jgi:arabinogalactan oligomer/maltooligosaccharide transport system substrate-binding protein
MTNCFVRTTHRPTQWHWRQRLSVWVVVFLLVACNNQSPPPTPTPTQTLPANSVDGNGVAAESAQQTVATPTPALSGRIVLWHSWAEADGDALAAILTAFQHQYPAVTVDTLFVAYNDLPQSYADAVRAGAGPDLMLAPSWWLNEMVAASVVQPLDALLGPAELTAYWPAALVHLRRNGQLYGLPTNFELVSLFYNRSLVAPEQTPATTDALLALAQQNPQQGSGLYASLYHLAWALPAYGAQLFADDGRIALDQNNGAAEFLTWLDTLSETPGSFVDLDYGMLLDRFSKSEFAFFVDGPWAIDQLRGALGDNLAVAPLPAGPAGPARPWLSADGVFLNPRMAPEQQPLALAFARFITGVEAGELLATNARRLPANLGVDLGHDPLLQGFMRQAESAQAMPANPEMANVWGYGGDMILKVLNEVDDPQQIVIETTTLINEANGK